MPSAIQKTLGSKGRRLVINFYEFFVTFCVKLEEFKNQASAPSKYQFFNFAFIATHFTKSSKGKYA